MTFSDFTHPWWPLQKPMKPRSASAPLIGSRTPRGEGDLLHHMCHSDVLVENNPEVPKSQVIAKINVARSHHSMKFGKMPCSTLQDHKGLARMNPGMGLET